jgi:acyl dehydratase
MNEARTLFTAEHVPSQAEFELFARVSGDDNPIHVNAAFSARTRFGRTVAHGMFLYTLIWSRTRAALPGVLSLEQTLKFPNPSYAGEALRLEATLEPAAAGHALVSARITRVADGEITCEATTLVNLGGRKA